MSSRSTRLRKLGESFSVLMPPRSSPTMRIGSTFAEAGRVNGDAAGAAWSSSAKAESSSQTPLAVYKRPSSPRPLASEAFDSFRGTRRSPCMVTSQRVETSGGHGRPRSEDESAGEISEGSGEMSCLLHRLPTIPGVPTTASQRRWGHDGPSNQMSHDGGCQSGAAATRPGRPQVLAQADPRRNPPRTRLGVTPMRSPRRPAETRQSWTTQATASG